MKISKKKQLINGTVLLKYDFSVAKRVMAWYAKNNLDKQYGANTADIWSNLTKYYQKHPEIIIADSEVLPAALLHFDELEIMVFAYGTLTDNLTRSIVLKRQVNIAQNSLCGFSMSSIKIEGVEYPAIIKSVKNDMVIKGIIFMATPEEIERIDKYETESYKRVQVTLVDDTMAWTYIKRD